MEDDNEKPVLSTAALSALQEFYAERATHQEKFKQLQEAANKNAESIDELSMDLFAENWQDSQFWYNDETARTLAMALLASVTEKEVVAMVSAPSVYVMARNLLREIGKPKDLWPKILLLEFDQRFKVIKDDYVFYDFRNPLNLPSELKGIVDHIICDPPFLSDDCQAKVAMTVQWLSKSWNITPELNSRESRLIICTGERMERTVTKLYENQGLFTTNYLPIHSKNQLSNEFSCYANFECDQWTRKE